MPTAAEGGQGPRTEGDEFLDAELSGQVALVAGSEQAKRPPTTGPGGLVEEGACREDLGPLNITRTGCRSTHGELYPTLGDGWVPDRAARPSLSSIAARRPGVHFFRVEDRESSPVRPNLECAEIGKRRITPSTDNSQRGFA